MGERGELLCSQGGGFGIGAQFVGVRAEALGNNVVVLSNDEGCDIVVRVGERVEEDGGGCVSRIRCMSNGGCREGIGARTGEEGGELWVGPGAV